MQQTGLSISPKVKVIELLEAFPELEEVLIEISPVFGKLKNPVLRKTVAKVATLQQVAIIGNMPVDELVNRLRMAAGQGHDENIRTDDLSMSEMPPEWFDKEKICDRFDATNMINSGNSPMAEVLQRANKLNSNGLFELTTPFVPAPIIDMLRKNGFKVWITKEACEVKSYIKGI